MNKTSAVIAAALLAMAGGSFAADAHTSADSAKGDGFIAKTERGLHRLGAKVRHAFHHDTADGKQAKQ